MGKERGGCNHSVAVSKPSIGSDARGAISLRRACMGVRRWCELPHLLTKTPSAWVVLLPFPRGRAARPDQRAHPERPASPAQALRRVHSPDHAPRARSAGAGGDGTGAQRAGGKNVTQWRMDANVVAWRSRVMIGLAECTSGRIDPKFFLHVRPLLPSVFCAGQPAAARLLFLRGRDLLRMLLRDYPHDIGVLDAYIAMVATPHPHICTTMCSFFALTPAPCQLSLWPYLAASPRVGRGCVCACIAGGEQPCRAQHGRASGR